LHGNDEIRAIIFDLGGVVVELTGVPRMLEWTGNNMTADELWARWLRSPAVRAFETGKSSANEFAANMVNEFCLPVSPDEFLSEFMRWPKALYPRVESLLIELKQNFITASF
jgi:putative hydrolase of the HAD superfamily